VPAGALILVALLSSACGAIARPLVSWQNNSHRKDAHLSKKEMEVAGHHVVYLDRGAGEPVLLIHGFGLDKDSWSVFSRFIPNGYRVVVPDLPGFGESTHSDAASYDVRAQAARVLAIADALGLERFHLAGSSLGGNIAARIAIDHPERVRSLLLVDSGGVAAPHPTEFAQALAAGRNELLVATPSDFDRVLRLTFVKPPAIPGFIKRYLAEQAVAHRAFNQKVFGDVLARPDPLEADLARIQAPTLVMWCDRDIITDVSTADVLTAGIRGAQKVLLANCGHLPMLERPEESATLYLKFLTALPGGR
jgi:abhydrolase domain-containing protein 6